MRRVLRFFLWGLVVLVALGGALFRYFVYSPAPHVPRLSGKVTAGRIEVGGRSRTYFTYVPHGLARGAPLVVGRSVSKDQPPKAESRSAVAFP